MRRSYRKRRILGVILIFMLLIGLLGCRLFYLQVIQGGKYSRAAVRQRSQSFVLDHGRGDVLDRFGVSLLDSRKKEVYVAFPSLYRQHEEVIRESLADEEKINRLVEPPHPNTPFIAARGEEAAAFVDKEESLPGILPAGLEVRYGPEALATHIVGHLAESSKGAKGIEKEFDNHLSGEEPSRLSVIVDGKNRPIDGLGFRLQESSGEGAPYNVVLTLDYRLQSRVENIMQEKIKKGAIAVVEPNSGDILAAVSKPDYDRLNIMDYMDSQEGEFHNRITRPYHPGSVFKSVIASAALEEGATDLFDEFNCTGEMEVEGRASPLGCLHLHDGNVVTLKEAFAHSCNTTFVEIALEMGADSVERYARLMGLGEPTGIGLSEHSGSIPEKQEIPTEANLANTALGQELVEVTPLQAARMMSVIANEGVIKPLRLVKRVENDLGRIKEVFPPGKGEKVLSSSTTSKMKYMLQAVVESGTGQNAALPDTSVGGKTGTAQYQSGGPQGHYYWFSGMTPLENPTAVIVVFIKENKKEAGAAEVFQEVAQAYHEIN